jgi:hypothetical protein
VTNVPGAGFVALLAVGVTLLALPLLASGSLLVARATRKSLLWTLFGVHTAAIAVGLAVFVTTSGIDGVQDAPVGAAVGFVGFALGVVGGGLVVAVVAEGIPIAVGAALTVVVGKASWRRGLWYATVGYALGGVGGALSGLTLTGSIEAAVLGALLAGPVAVAAPVLEAVATRRQLPTP